MDRDSIQPTIRSRRPPLPPDPQFRGGPLHEEKRPWRCLTFRQIADDIPLTLRRRNSKFPDFLAASFATHAYPMEYCRKITPCPGCIKVICGEGCSAPGWAADHRGAYRSQQLICEAHVKMPKNIVFCADGTWNHPDETDDGVPTPTNVYKLFNALLQTDTQAPHYNSGVGTDGTPIDHLLGGAIGEGLFQKIRDGYTTIARSYQDGDQIYLFGFSRGAYTARSLAGMIAVCGLPEPGKFDADATNAAFTAYRAPKAGIDRSPLLDNFVTKYSAARRQNRDGRRLGYSGRVGHPWGSVQRLGYRCLWVPRHKFTSRHSSGIPGTSNR